MLRRAAWSSPFAAQPQVMLNNLGESAELLDRFVGDYSEESRRAFSHVQQRDQELIAVSHWLHDEEQCRLQDLAWA